MNTQFAGKPTLKSVHKLCASKDVDFLQFFNSTNSCLYESVRHRFTQLNIIVLDGLGHMRLFVKYLQKTIAAQKHSADTCLQIVEDYRDEEPTLSIISLKKIEDEAVLTLPALFSKQEHKNNIQTESDLDIVDNYRKTDIDVYTDIYGIERNMAKLYSLYWKKLESDVYLPLHEFRKKSSTKVENIRSDVCRRYEKLIKTANKVHDEKTKAITLWNELCDVRHRLRKSRATNEKSSQTKKLTSKLVSMENKTKKVFENIVEIVDKFNNLQDDFWNITIYNACLQLEAIEYTRICFYSEYFDKYEELLHWKRTELQNGERILQRAKAMLMSPFEITEYFVHPIRVDHGNYRPIAPQQYELPCMPFDVKSISGKFSEQRIDPSILLPVYDPFLDELVKAKLLTREQSVLSTRSRPFSSFSNMNNNISKHGSVDEISRSHSDSIVSNSTVILHESAASLANKSFFKYGDIKQQSLSLFARTHRAQTHVGGLPPPSDESSNIFVSNNNISPTFSYTHPNHNIITEHSLYLSRKSMSNTFCNQRNKSYATLSSDNSLSSQIPDNKIPIHGFGLGGKINSYDDGFSLSVGDLSKIKSSRSANSSPRYAVHRPLPKTPVAVALDNAPPLPNRSPANIIKHKLPDRPPPNVKQFAKKHKTLQDEKNDENENVKNIDKKKSLKLNKYGSGKPPPPKKSIASVVEQFNKMNKEIINRGSKMNGDVSGSDNEKVPPPSVKKKRKRKPPPSTKS